MAASAQQGPTTVYPRALCNTTKVPPINPDSVFVWAKSIFGSLLPNTQVLVYEGKKKGQAESS